MSTYKEIRDSLLNLAGQDAGGEFEDMTNRAINRAYKRLLAEVNQDEVRREFTQATVADTSQYGMPLNVSRILNIENTDSRRRLRELTDYEFDTLYPGTTASGEPRQYYVLGTFGVQSQPSAAGAITLVSDSAADVTNFFVRVQGLDANGVWITEQVTITSTSSVTTTASFTTVEQISKSQNSGFSWAGIVTVTDAAANVLTRIPKAVTSPSHLWVEYYPIPDAVESHTVRAMARKPELFNDDDWPQIHEDWHQMIELIAGPELMVAAGKPDQASRMIGESAELLRKFKSRSQYRPHKVSQFRDVQSAVNFAPDDRMLVKGIDFI